MLMVLVVSVFKRMLHVLFEVVEHAKLVAGLPRQLLLLKAINLLVEDPHVFVAQHALTPSR